MDFPAGYARWPLVVIYFYRTRSIQAATLWSILGEFMFLPVKTVVDLPTPYANSRIGRTKE